MQKNGTVRLNAPCLALLLAPLLLTASSLAISQEAGERATILHAVRVFDGTDMKTDTSVLVVNGQIAQIGPRDSIKFDNAKVIELGDATILPGFIELHAHLSFRNIPADTVLRHGITTIRDVGGPLHKPYGGDGDLRVLTSGPIITAPNGYPIPFTGTANIAIAVSSEEEARATVRHLIDGGAVVIKIALEPGGEAGAPWTTGHGHDHEHGHGHDHQDAAHPDKPHEAASNTTPSTPAWPLLPGNIVSTIVDEAHKNKRKVTAHIAEMRGARIAVDAGVDEWAHMPCEVIPEPLLKKAAAQRVKIVTTLDTLSKCPGVALNAAAWTALGGELLYGAEVAHPDIPWGIDAQELTYMMNYAKMGAIDVLRAATSKAGRHLGLPLLGTIQRGAPADMIAVKGDPTRNLKILEYPDLVIAGGKIVLNNLSAGQSAPP